MDQFHTDIIISNLEVLVDETDLNKLIPELLKRRVLNEQMIFRILNPIHNSKIQKTDLYLAILKRGPNAFDCLQSALESTNHFKLAKLLKDETMKRSRNKWHGFRRPKSIESVTSNSRNTTDHCGRSMPDSFPMAYPNDVMSSQKMFQIPQYMEETLKFNGLLPPVDNYLVFSDQKYLPVKVKLATQFRENNLNELSLYKMDSNPRGLALIVNNINIQSEEERKGAENDEYRLQELLKQLHYQVEVHRDKTAREMVEIAKQFSRKPELYECDSVIVSFMSHGEEGESIENSNILGADGIGVPVYDIISLFYNDACEALIDKPKIFFLQACRGVLEDHGVDIQGHNYYRRIGRDGRRLLSAASAKVRSQSDIFVAYPVPPGMRANRDRITGTWFIQSIVDIFSKHAWNTHLDDMMKLVDSYIKELNCLYTVNFQTVTSTTIGWHKNLYFNPGLARNPITGEVIRLGENQDVKNDEGMDVTDDISGLVSENTSEPSIKACKGEKKEDDDDDGENLGCFSFSRCNPS